LTRKIRSEEMAKAKKHDESKLKEDVEEIAKEEINEEIKEPVSEEGTGDPAAAEIKSLNDRLLRLQADFLNYKSRSEKEKTSSYGNATADLITDLLPVVDNLERALAAAEEGPFKEGVQMVYNQFMGILNKKGLQEVEALHKPFDHNVHYGVAFEESEDHDDGTIIDVLQKGYTVNDKCIRPSMVRICRR